MIPAPVEPEETGRAVRNTRKGKPLPAPQRTGGNGR